MKTQTRKGFRNKEFVQSVVLRMGKEYVIELDALCTANRRSRRELIEFLVREAHCMLEIDSESRISPM